MFTNRSDLPRGAVRGFALAMILLGSGCAMETVSKTPVGMANYRALDGKPIRGEVELVPVQTSRVMSEVRPMGSIPYDDLSLPLVSPRGNHIATQNGLPPDPSILLAEQGAAAHSSSRVEIYELGYQPSAGGESVPPRLTRTIDKPVLLGRSTSADGFLVEWPRSDGSRWIGLADWHTAEVDWLVADQQVNAFASLGPEQRLAWSRRAYESTDLDLVIRTADGREWVLPAEGGDWIMPTWSGHGSGLFVLRLRNGFLDLVYGDASSPERFRASETRTPIAHEANRFIAYQAMNAVVNIADEPMRGEESIVLYHPAAGQAAVWHPHRGGLPVRLGFGSMHGIFDGQEHLLVTTDEELFRLDPLHMQRKSAALIRGLLVPRRLTHPNWRFLLLSPQDGRIGLTALRLHSGMLQG